MNQSIGPPPVRVITVSQTGVRLSSRYPQDMAGLPMRCPKCGWRFEAENFIHASPGTQLTVTGSQVSCPRPGCLGMAVQVQEGTFEVSSSGKWNLLKEALKPKDATAADYRVLYGTLLEAQRNHASREDVARRISSSAPKFNTLGELVLSQKGSAAATWLQVILMIVFAAIQSQAGNSSSTVTNNNNVTLNMPGISQTDIGKQVDDAIAKAEQEGKLPPG